MAYNPFSLEGKTILVTGASSGIGRGVAVECSKMGAKMVITGRNVDRLNDTFSMLEGDAHLAIPVDLSTQAGIDNLVLQCPEINGVVHCAGIPQMCTVKHIDRKSLEEILNINTITPIILNTLLIKKKKLQKKSSIVLISSISGVAIGNVGESTYSTSKGALSGYTKSAAYELASQGTRVNSINPGIVPTKILELSNNLFSKEQLEETTKGKYPLKRYGTPEDIANGAIYLLSDASSWVTGINLIIDGGYTIL